MNSDTWIVNGLDHTVNFVKNVPNRVIANIIFDLKIEYFYAINILFICIQIKPV
jgi:hypothetical protein